MTETTFDYIVIGAGPGGYVSAIRAAQLGMKVACIEKGDTLGGTCLNVGCIPSKALLASSHFYAQMKNEGTQLGIRGAAEIGLDLAQMMAHKDATVRKLTEGIAYLFKKNKVTHIRGAATFERPGVVRVGDALLKAPHIVIATGSEPVPLPGITIDEKRIVSSTGALALKEVPAHLVVVGGGYIGLEMASVWARLGSQVTVVECAEALLPMLDRDVADALQKVLSVQGLTFMLNTEVKLIETTKQGATLTLQSRHDGEKLTLTADVVLMAVGRRPYTQGLGLERIGVTLDKRGQIPVSSHYETSCPGVYAIGDVIAGPMLAHKAEEEGNAVAEIAVGQKPHVNYGALPSVIYTFPEVASVGETETALKAAGRAYKVGKFPLSANGRALAQGDPVGFVKVVADAVSDRVLGVHMIGAEAGTMIAEAVLALEYQASAEDIALTIHAHPTLSEALKEAALAVDGRALHI